MAKHYNQKVNNVEALRQEPVGLVQEPIRRPVWTEELMRGERSERSRRAARDHACRVRPGAETWN